jgi:integrase
MNKRFIKYLKSENISSFLDITPQVIFNFQNYLLSLKNKAGTINRYLGSVKAVFDYLFMTGTISNNVFDNIKMLKTGGRKKNAVRGCLDIDKLNGVFSKEWKSIENYMLCLMIYSTGMRNSELEGMRKKDIMQIDEYNFITIDKSKTENGIRTIPLHPFVYKKLFDYAKGMTDDSFIFSANGNHNQSTLYTGANIELGENIGMDEPKLKKNKISFYSGRHFWKTMMNSKKLGDDIEEYFMGHKVSTDVSKRYNHKDKQGKKKLIGKTRLVFKILDDVLFVVKPYSFKPSIL